MDVIVIFNGLGNQMSQYAFYLEKRKLNDATYLISFCKDHNGLELHKVFGINFKSKPIERILYLIYRILLTDKTFLNPLKYLFKIMGCKIVNENYDYNFKPNYMIPSKGITFYFGGWHTQKYFSGVKEDLLTTFKFDRFIDKENIATLVKIKNTNSVALHVRRGDYMNEANINLFGRVCTKAYFEKAINTLNKKVLSPHYFIFSNDIEWVKQNLVFERATFVNHNLGADSWKDMCLMSECKHNIISNSTFSWWGAWLNKHQDKVVISPSRFLNDDQRTDVYPSDWLKIADY
ncbi:MAG: alpha-1,2-fucosyltransferase [Pedobacter sp.]|nr:MAG: alpha-1,2-fucosyltransferase [Pedobacter sp.]